MDQPAAAFRLRPRLDPKPWGGDRLGPAAPGSPPIGEAVATAGDAVVAESPAAGRSLAEIVAADPFGVIGRRGLAVTGGRPLFPLLIKRIDAAQPLSLQVHPAAETAPDGVGKTEVYHVLAAEPGAAIALGLRPGVPLDRFAAACRAGAGGGDLVRWLPAVPGETILIPAGTIHALGAGCFVYELQQPSDVTYRLDDWGRVDAAGRPRDLHVDQALAALDARLRPSPIAPLPIAAAAGRRHLLAACRLFALERIALEPGEAVDAAAPGSAQAVTCLDGGVDVIVNGDPIAAAAGETVVVRADAQRARIHATGSARLLRAWVPDLATEVVGPARAAGHPDDAIVALAGPLPDLRPPPTLRPPASRR